MPKFSVRGRSALYAENKSRFETIYLRAPTTIRLTGCGQSGGVRPRPTVARIDAKLWAARNSCKKPRPARGTAVPRPDAEGKRDGPATDARGASPRGRGGPHRVHPGVVDRPSDPGDRPDRVPGATRQGVRGGDPARRDSRDLLGLSRALLPRRDGPAARPRAGPLRAQHPARLHPGDGDRSSSRTASSSPCCSAPGWW